MTNYLQDEEDRTEDRRRRAERNSVKLGNAKTHLYTVALNDEQFLQVAKKAAIRNVTFNQMVNMTLLKNLKDDEQFENSSQLLNEG